MIATILSMAMVTSTEVTFEGPGGMKLAGILELPATGKAPYPCIMLMPGSGPTDRDGNQPPMLVTNLLKDLATSFRAAGIATFRFDKRPVARYMSVWPKEIASIGEFFSFENHIADAVAGYKFVADQTTIDAKRIAVLGHSEGGMIASEMTKFVSPRTLILVGAPGRPMREILTEQVANSLERSKAPEALKTQLMKELADSCDAVIAEKPLNPNLHPGLRSLFNPTSVRIWQGYFKHDAKTLLATFGQPVLVVNGESDIQISPTKDAPLLMAALTGRKDGQQRLFIAPKASHNLKLVSEPTDAGFEGAPEPTAVKAMTEWLVKVLG